MRLPGPSASGLFHKALRRSNVGAPQRLLSIRCKIVCMYEGENVKSFTTFIAMQPLVADHAFMPHLKALYVPFHMAFSGLICSKGLQSDRPKWRGRLAEVSQTSLCKTVSKTIQNWCEKGSVPAFLAVTWLYLGTGQAIIPHLKEDIQGYLLI